MAKPAFTLNQASNLRKRYEEGETSVSLAKEFNVGDGCIVSWIKRVGGIIRSNSESKRKFTFDEHYWDIVDTEHKAYWMGFFMADGYIGAFDNKYRNFWCTLAAKDGHHLEEFIKDINATYKVVYYQRKNKKTGKIYDKCRICLTSIPFVENLVNKGWIDFKKNGDLKLFSHIPSVLHSHFVRGFFDGDGSIGKQLRRKRKSLAHAYSVTIVAPFAHEKFLEQVRDIICNNAGVSIKSLKRGSSVFRCHWNGNRQIMKIGDWLYKAATRWLARKKERFDSIHSTVRIEWPSNNRFTCSHTPGMVSKLSTEQQEKAIQYFCDLMKRSKWVALEYTEDQLLADYRNIIIYDSNLYAVMENNNLVGFRLNTGGNRESPGKKMVLHFQPHFWDVRTSGPTIPSQWHNMTVIKKAATALLTSGTKVSLMRFLREMRYAGTGVTSHFHPNFAMSIIQNLAPDSKSWFDPCMGWGGRLMASHVLGIAYEGCDPQPDTFKGLRNIKEFIKSSAILYNCKAQDFVFEKEYDLGFTSPPFFNKEKYGSSEQSYFEFSQYEQWLTEFLCPLVDKLRKHCRKVILHVDSRISADLMKLYDCVDYPLFLQRNPGSPKSTESVLLFK